MGAQEAGEGGNEVQNELQAPGSWVTGGGRRGGGVRRETAWKLKLVHI